MATKRGPYHFIVLDLKMLDSIFHHIEGDLAYVRNDDVLYVHDDTQTLFPLHWRKVEDHD